MLQRLLTWRIWRRGLLGVFLLALPACMTAPDLAPTPTVPVPSSTAAPTPLPTATPLSALPALPSPTPTVEEAPVAALTTPQWEPPEPQKEARSPYRPAWARP